MLDHLKSRKGFTLIEIVVVIVIIAILAAILVPSLTSWVDKAKISTIQESVGQIRSSLMSELYEMSKEKSVINTNQNSDIYDAEFWKSISDHANTDLSKDNLKFAIGDELRIIEITYSKGGHTATYDYDNNEWTVE